MAQAPRITHPGSVEMPGLRLDQCGWEACEPGHRFGPAVRDYMLIHYVAQGGGSFWDGDGVGHLIAAGDVFVIFPGQTTVYEADPAAPWEYYWVGFSGPAAAGLMEQAAVGPDRPVFHINEDPAEVAGLVMDIYTSALMQGGALRAMGGLLRFLGLVAGGAAPAAARPAADTVQADYVAQAMRYVQAHYQSELTVDGLAAHVGIDRSHLYRVFVACTGSGPRQYIVGVRVQQAARLLSETAMPLGQVAEAAGFSSPTHFGVAFKRAYGMAPGAYRRGLGRE